MSATHATSTSCGSRGWWGHDKASRFEMPHEFQPMPGAEGWQISNPPILAAAPLLASLPLFDARRHAGAARQIAAADGLPGIAVAGAAGGLADDPHARGSRSARLPAFAAPPALALLKRTRCSIRSRPHGVICDWREPDIIRVAPVPLYNSFVDVWEFVAALGQALR